MGCLEEIFSFSYPPPILRVALPQFRLTNEWGGKFFWKQHIHCRTQRCPIKIHHAIKFTWVEENETYYTLDAWSDWVTHWFVSAWFIPHWAKNQKVLGNLIWSFEDLLRQNCPNSNFRNYKNCTIINQVAF